MRCSALGVDVWFNLGERALAWCMEAGRMISGGIDGDRRAARGHLNAGVLGSARARSCRWATEASSAVGDKPPDGRSFQES